MIITVTELTQEFTKNGAEYVKVRGTTPDGSESTKSVFSNLKDSWDLLEVGAALDFTMEKKGQFWNVIAIKPVGQKAAEKTTPQPVKPAQPGEIKQPISYIAPQGKGLNSDKNKAFALSYAKDLAVGGTIDNDSILKWADKFLEWLN